MSIAKKFEDGRKDSDRISTASRDLVRALVYEMESGRSHGEMSVAELLDAIDNNRTPPRRHPSETERAAQDAIDDYERIRPALEQEEDPDNLHQVRSQAGPTRAGALRMLARELSRERSLDDDDYQAPATAPSPEEMLESIVQRVMDRRGGR